MKINDAEKERRAQEIFLRALEVPGAEARGGFVAGASGGDEELAARVKALLASDISDDFLEGPAPGAGSVTVSNPAQEQLGDTIGRYKLLEKLGEGGFGYVYMAEQREPVKRRVALKIIKAGMDTREVIGRFEAERQALALMDHPNIARVLDAGATEKGRPYFVLELVRGIKITDYCEQNHTNLEDRLKLFMQVCQAVQHAHQKGIIHRDLKPSNILVTLHDGVPVPKVIDFGIAKATQQELTDKTVFTRFHQFIGTPAYMSPEQAELSGLDIDTRSDIYSLGVLLYELLTGQTPFDGQELMKAGIDAMRQTIKEVEPPPPSTKARETSAAASPAKRNAWAMTLASDLDWIVMKCLEKDRARRYETANGLAADIQRHLGNEPVTARPPSQIYRLQKAVRRNKAAFASAAAVALALVLGLAASLRMYARARAAELEQVSLRKKAEASEKAARTEAAKSEQVAKFLTEMLEGIRPSVALGRDTMLIREVLEKTAKRVGTDLKGQPEVEVKLRNTVADVYRNIGDLTKAEEMINQALALRPLLKGAAELDIAAALHLLSDVCYRRDEREKSEKFSREALEIRQRHLGAMHVEVAKSLNALGNALRFRGEAEKTHRAAADMLRKLDAEPALLALVLINLSLGLWDQDRNDEAYETLKEAVAIQQKVLGEEHPDVGLSCQAASVILAKKGKLAEAEEMGKKALAIYRKVLGNESDRVADSLENLGRWAMERQDRAAAARYFKEALPILKKVHGAEHLRVRNGLVELTAALTDDGKAAEGEPYAREALALTRKLFGADAEEMLPVMNNMGATLLFQGRHSEAEAVLRESLALSEKLGSANSLEYVLANLGRLLSETGRGDEVDGLYGEFLKKTDDEKLKAFLHDRRGTIRAESGRWNEAVREFSQAVALRPDHHSYYHVLAPALYEAGQIDRYRQVRGEMLKRFADTEDYNTAERMAKDSVLAPMSERELEMAARLAEKAVKAPANHADYAWFANAKAMIEYRKGELESAIRWAEKAEPNNKDHADRATQANLILALARQKLGQAKEASANLKKALAVMEEKMQPNGVPEGNWHDWVIARVLLREAREMIEGAPAAGGIAR